MYQLILSLVPQEKYQLIQVGGVTFDGMSFTNKMMDHVEVDIHYLGDLSILIETYF